MKIHLFALAVSAALLAGCDQGDGVGGSYDGDIDTDTSGIVTNEPVVLEPQPGVQDQGGAGAMGGAEHSGMMTNDAGSATP